MLIPPQSKDTAALVYAVLPEGLLAWAVRGETIDQHFIGATTLEIRNVAERFRRTCSRPTSELALVRADATQLYRWLIEPFESDLQGARVLLIDADDWLAGVPFSVLLNRDGHYLIESQAITMAPHTSRPTLVMTPTLDHGLIVSAPSPEGRTFCVPLSASSIRLR